MCVILHVDGKRRILKSLFLQKDKLKSLLEATHALKMTMDEFEDNLVRSNMKMKTQLVTNGDPTLSPDRPSGIDADVHPVVVSLFLVLQKLLPPPSYAEALNLFRKARSSPNWRQIETSLPNSWLQFGDKIDENINKLTNSPASLITSRTEYKYSPVTVSACYEMSGKALLLGWRILPNSQISGFEISVDGVLVKRINSPTRNVALLPDVDPTDEHLVTVNAVPLIPGDSRWIPAQFIYRAVSRSSS
ncbi:uncharacterized protein LOC132264924 [Phlebotomus argentipes]|uniref:uncharacterized protein LOC132264924 n=1 Tax=Phlebotomus argentipes TaxID=94469 RepID=UPI002892BDF8|nr:uncharacterized protein LOC132264924 [Phlebotomus argentipes]